MPSNLQVEMDVRRCLREAVKAESEQEPSDNQLATKKPSESPFSYSAGKYYEVLKDTCRRLRALGHAVSDVSMDKATELTGVVLDKTIRFLLKEIVGPTAASRGPSGRVIALAALATGAAAVAAYVIVRGRGK